MPEAAATGEDDTADLDALLREYRQGDVLTLNRAVHLDLPTADGKSVRADVSAEGDGVVLLTQTCDIVKPSASRPYVQVAPLVREPDERKAEAWREGASPRYVWLPRIGLDAFVDLDHITTVTKGLLVTHGRQPGVDGDEEERTLRFRLGRKLSRPALPDDLAPAMGKLRERIEKKWDKAESAEGRLLQAVRQVRVAPQPTWSADVVHVDVIFIMSPGALPGLATDPTQPSGEVRRWFATGRSIAEIAERIEKTTDEKDAVWLWQRLGAAWAEVCVPHGVIDSFAAEVVGADEFTLDRYWSSEEFDVDYLSGPGD